MIPTRSEEYPKTIREYSKNVFGIYKPAGYTPLQALHMLKAKSGMSSNIACTYAGRLDPMAEGLLLVLAGEAVHKKDEFLKLDKRYTVTALLGVTTDSFDLLGMPKAGIRRLENLDFDPSAAEAMADNSGVGMTERSTVTEEHIRQVLQSYNGNVTLPLPLYSSPSMGGKPLFQHAQQNTLAASDTPERTTTIFDCNLVSISSIGSRSLLDYIHTTIVTIQGDFRQTVTLEAWQQLLSKETELQTITAYVHCSSGTYMRSLVQDLGTQLGIGACIYTLVRTRIGPYAL